MMLGLKSTSPVKTPCFVHRTTMFKDSTHKHFKLKLEVVLGGGLQSEPILANNATSFRGRKASLGYISLWRICIIQLCLDNHQSTDISEYCAHWCQGKALFFKLESLWRLVSVCGGYGWQLADMPHMHSPHEIILNL